MRYATAMPQLEQQREKGMRASAEAGRRINENSRHSGPDDAEGGRDIRYFISRVSLSVRVRFRRSNIFPFLSHRRRETGNADGGTVEINAATKNGYSLSDRGEGGREGPARSPRKQPARPRAGLQRHELRQESYFHHFFGPVLPFPSSLSSDQRYHTPIITCLRGLRSRSPSGCGGGSPSGNGEVYKRPVTKKCRTEGGKHLSSCLKQGIGKTQHKFMQSICLRH